MKVTLLKTTYWPTCSKKEGDNYLNPAIVSGLPEGAEGNLEYRYSIPYLFSADKHDLYEFIPDDPSYARAGRYMTIGTSLFETQL